MKLSTFDEIKRLRPEGTIELDPPTLRRLQLTLLGIVKDVFACCERHNLTCVLGGGTALGAVRHGGFIPWDDDVDLNMSRKDYDAFVGFFREEFSDRYWLHTPDATERLGLAQARVRLKGTTFLTREDQANGQTECGVFVDLFIVENTFDNFFLRAIHGLGSMAIGFLYSCRKLYHERKWFDKYAGGQIRSFAALKLKRALGFLVSFASLFAWVKIWDGWNRLCRNDRSKFVTIPVGRRHFWGELCPRSEMCESRPIAFEGLTLKAPARVEDYMRRNYGPDYMTPPPPEKRERHVVFVDPPRARSPTGLRTPVLD